MHNPLNRPSTAKKKKSSKGVGYNDPLVQLIARNIPQKPIYLGAASAGPVFRWRGAARARTTHSLCMIDRADTLPSSFLARPTQ